MFVAALTIFKPIIAFSSSLALIHAQENIHL
jgi:hypothetical protein